jgi:hypothetical protein
VTDIDERLQGVVELLQVNLRQVDLVVGTVHAETDCSRLGHEVDIIKELALTGCGDIDFGHDYPLRVFARALLDARAKRVK